MGFIVCADDRDLECDECTVGHVEIMRTVKKVTTVEKVEKVTVPVGGPNGALLDGGGAAAVAAAAAAGAVPAGSLGELE